MSLGISYKFSSVDGISRTAKKIARNVSNITSKMRRMESQSDRSSSKINRMFKKMSRSTGALSGRMKGLAATAAGVFAIGNIAKKGMEFEDAIAGVSVITGAAGEDLKKFELASIAISKEFGISAAEIATGLKDIASGKSELLQDPDALIRITRDVTELAKAASIDVPEAVKATVTSLNQWGKGAEAASRFSNILAVGAKVGASEIADTAEALKNAGSVAAAAGIDFLTTNAALQAISKGGLKASEAGTGLAGVLKGIKTKLKVDTKGKDFLQLLEAIDKARRAGAIDTLDVFGAEHEKTALALLDNVKHMRVFVKEMREARGEVAKQAKIRMDTLSSRMAKARVRFDLAMLNVFEKLEPVISKITDDFIRWTDSLTSRDIQGFQLILSGIATGISGFFSLLGTIKDGLVELGKKIGELVAKIEQLMIKVFGTTENMKKQIIARPMLQGLKAIPGANVVSTFIESQLFKESVDVNVNVKDPGSVIENVQTTKKSGGRKTKVKTSMEN